MPEFRLKSGSLLSDKAAFLREITEPLVGWLDMYAAARTLDLLDFQSEQGVTGALLEIGLYYGKYFSLLVRGGLLTGDRVVGVDTFDYVPYANFHSNFREHAQLDHFADQGPSEIEYVQAKSSIYDGATLLAVTKSSPRFISIDGSHDFDDVFWDLRMSEQILGSQGIIAMDDFLNHACLGVNEAITKILASTPSLVPFAYICNKLFCARPAFADWYKDALEQAIMSDGPDPRSNYFRQYAQSIHRKQVETTYFGRKVLSIPL